MVKTRADGFQQRRVEQAHAKPARAEVFCKDGRCAPANSARQPANAGHSAAFTEGPQWLK